MPFQNEKKNPAKRSLFTYIVCWSLVPLFIIFKCSFSSHTHSIHSWNVSLVLLHIFARFLFFLQYYIINMPYTIGHGTNRTRMNKRDDVNRNIKKKLKVIRNWKRWLCQVQTCFKLKNGFSFYGCQSRRFNWGKCTWGFFYCQRKCMRNCITHIIILICMYVCVCVHSIPKVYTSICKEGIKIVR